MLLVPVLLDGPNDPQPGLFRLDTSAGPVVVLFRTRAELERFAGLMAARLEPRGEQLGCMETPFDRVEDVVDMLVEQKTSTRGEEIFIDDAHPLYHKLTQLL